VVEVGKIGVKEGLVACDRNVNWWGGGRGWKDWGEGRAAVYWWFLVL